MGTKYTADEALKCGIVHATSPDVLSKTMEMAAKFEKENLSGPMMAQLKNDVYYDVCKALTEPTSLYSKI